MLRSRRARFFREIASQNSPPSFRPASAKVIAVTERAGGVMFEVRVQPRASRDEISGEYQGALRIRLMAPPIENRANEALCRLLAERLNVPRAAVKILSGDKSRMKRVLVHGIAAAQINALA